MSKKYIDIKIYDDDLARDGDGMPLFVWDKDSIVQDMKHAIRESGYLVNMVAERSEEKRSLFIQKIILLVEEDKRIIPGTVLLEQSGEIIDGNGMWTLSADTYEFGKASLILEA